MRPDEEIRQDTFPGIAPPPYLSNTAIAADRAAIAIRDHWKIENTSHYFRNVTMGEDRSRIRINPGVFARPGVFAFNILKANRRSALAQDRFRAAIAGRDRLLTPHTRALNGPGIERVHHVVQRVMRRDAATERQHAAQEGELAEAPEANLHKILGPRQRGAQHHEHDLRQWLQHLAGLARVG